MNGSTAESETPEEMGRRQFLACICGTLATPLAVVIGDSLAASLVGPGATIALNGGTTTIEVVRALATRSDLQSSASNQALTIVTNALNIANELVVRPRVKLVVTGGVARPQSYELIGPLAEPLLEGLAFDYAILGVDAVNSEEGASAHHEGEAEISRLMESFPILPIGIGAAGEGETGSLGSLGAAAAEETTVAPTVARTDWEMKSRRFRFWFMGLMMDLDGSLRKQNHGMLS